MQLVTLLDLEKLAQHSVKESLDSFLAQGLSFKDICSAYRRKKKELLDSSQNAYDVQYMAYSWLNNNVLYAKCPPIVLVGKGTSRTAYACLGGRCLKVAFNNAGVEQNKQEEKHTKKHWWRKSYSCFVQTYGSSDDYSLLLSECCAKIEQPSQLANAFEMPGIRTFRAIITAISTDKKHDIASAASRLKYMAANYRHIGKDFSCMTPYADVANDAAKWLDTFTMTSSSAMTPSQKTFNQLVSFWKKNGIDELLPGDVNACDNWGFAIRDGQIAPVIIDVGFSKSIANRFYS